MAKVLKKDDFPEDPKDTSANNIPSDAMMNEKGEVVKEEPKEEKVEKKEEVVEEKPKGGEEPQPKPSDEKKYKYKSMDEYDKAYKEAERKMHEATTRAKSVESELAQLRRPTEPKTPTIDERIEGILDDAYKQVRAIPLEYDAEGKPTPPSVEKGERVANAIWAKAYRTISRLEFDEREKETTNWKRTASKLTKRAKEEGMASDDEMDMVAAAYDRLSDVSNVDDRIDQAVETTKARLTRLRGDFVTRQEKDKQEKDSLKVLGRGSSRTETKEDKGSNLPATMIDAMHQTRKGRIVKRDDLR